MRVQGVGALMGHCPQCDAYEAAVLAMPPGGSIAADVVPCAQYVMGPELRDHIVSQMRGEVAGQVAGAGLNRMAVVKAGDAPAAGTGNAARASASRMRGVRLGPGGVPVRRN